LTINTTETHQPKVSIIVPVYNRETLVKRLISTVQQQTFQDWELLLIDDASTDDTVEVIKSAMLSDDRIVLQNNTHKKGPSGARNTGLDIASGKYIAYQDSDDEWFEHHLEKMVHYLDKSDGKIDLMSADPLRKYEETGEVFNYDKMAMETIPHTHEGELFLINPDCLFEKQLMGRVITTQCMVGKSAVLKAVRWNESLNAAVDILYNLEVCSQNITVGHLSDYHAIYWAHKDNLTNVGGGHSPERMERVQRSFIRYWELVLETFTLTQNQQHYVETNLAKSLAWHLAYHSLEPQGKFKEATTYYLKAIKIKPSNFKYYKAFSKALFKSMFKSNAQ
jgi:glycosyltransferase involved in cell wall biosynthesis